VLKAEGRKSEGIPSRKVPRSAFLHRAGDNRANLVDPSENGTEQILRYCNFRHLEDRVSSMPYHLRADLDEFFSERCHRPSPDRLWQRQLAEEVPEVVRQGEELEPDLVVCKIMAGQPCPIHGVLPFLDPLLGCSALVIEMNHVLRSRT